MKPILRTGDEVRITFEDHSEDDEPYVFTVWGRLAKVTRRHYVVKNWEAAEDGWDHTANEVTYSILRSTIKKAVKLVAQ